MKILDFNKIDVFPHKDRDKNVLYKEDDFKIRVIELPQNGIMPECEILYER